MKCIAYITIKEQGKVVNAKVEGGNSNEVSSVVKTMFKSIKGRNNILVSGEPINSLTSADQKLLEVINDKISELLENQQKKLGGILSELTIKVVESTDMDTKTRSKAIRQIAFLVQAINQKNNTSKSKRILQNLGNTLNAVGGLASAWSAWSPLIIKSLRL